MRLRKLIRECKKNDPRAQGELYKLYAAKIFPICLKYSRNHQEAQDNLHDSFITVFKKIHQFDYRGSLEGWIKKITINTTLAKYRAKGVFDLLPEKEIPDLYVEVEDEVDIDIDYLLHIVQELPDRYRLVFNLYALDGYAHKQIAEMLNISVGTSKSNLFRARLILKEKVNFYLSHQKSRENLGGKRKSI